MEQATGFIHDCGGEPFFLYLAHMHVHLPLYAQERFLKQSRNGDYGACVECIDWATGAILRQLEEEGVMDDTLVIFTSDNGCRGDNGGSNAPLRGTKGTTWEGGQRVPCILYWPGMIPAGETCGQILSSIDFLPTIAGLCCAEPRPDRKIDGVDFAPLLENPGGPALRDTFFYYLRNNLEAVRRGQWKLHAGKGGESFHALYNLAADVGEEKDVAAVHPEIVEELEALLAACR